MTEDYLEIKVQPGPRPMDEHLEWIIKCYRSLKDTDLDIVQIGGELMFEKSQVFWALNSMISDDNYEAFDKVYQKFEETFPEKSISSTSLYEFVIKMDDDLKPYKF